MDLYQLTKTALEKRCTHMLPKGYYYEVYMLERNNGESSDTDHLSSRMISQDTIPVYIKATAFITKKKAMVGKFDLPKRALLDKTLFLAYTIVAIKRVLSQDNFKLYLP